VLGAICLVSDSGRTKLPRQAVTMEGLQHGFVVSMKIIQRFKNPHANTVDLSYVIPSNCKICLYDTRFRIRDEVI
jgi:hypothetical protein